MDIFSPRRHFKPMYFIVSIDTEEDMPNWRPEPETSVKNIDALPKLQQLFDKYGVRPSYLVNYPVLTDANACGVLKKIHEQHNCEIGLHLHSWNSPPITEQDKQKATVLNDISDNIQVKKIERLHHYFIDQMGFSPTSYRAGRYGITNTTLITLAKLGYVVDSSVVPLTNYNSYNAPDFSEFNFEPFWIKNCTPGLLEIPVSVDLVSWLPDRLKACYFKIPDRTHIKGLFHRLNIARLLWLRPTTYSISEMKQVIDHIMKNMSGPPVFNMMFHSSEFYPGATPYNKTKEDVKKFQHRLESAIKYVVGQLGAKPVTLSQFAHELRSGGYYAYSKKKVLFN